MNTQNFELVVDGVPYLVKATPFDFNQEKRFTVTFNGSEEYVFVFDTSVGRYMALGDEGVDIPSRLEVEIAERLFSMA
ncbi:hypothetical protein [Aridibaculum aurantiacum]|uniref:hypothetical protein n=1 Tax=Aridibaculum aurantiacum TaxID=2810307 RepID=UPI001A95CB95|nr:hypothetical protein [Aridibaculum aurantiacum]